MDESLRLCQGPRGMALLRDMEERGKLDDGRGLVEHGLPGILYQRDC